MRRDGDKAPPMGGMKSGKDRYMSLISTLAKMAIGIAVAKGVSTLAKAGRGTRSAGSGAPMGDSYSPIAAVRAAWAI